MSTQTPIAETSVAVGGTKVERRGLTDIVYHVFDKPGKYTFTVKSKIPAIEYLVVGASGGTINGYTPGGGGAVVTGATTSSLEPGEYAVEVGSIGGKVETKVTMVNCNQNATTCKQTPYTQSMSFPNGSYTGVPSGTYLSCGGIQSTPTKMTEEIYGPGGDSSFLTYKANGGGPGAQKPTMVSKWDRENGRYNTSVPANQYQYAFPESYWNALQGKAPGNPAFTAFSCGQFDLDYIAGASGSGHGGTRFQNCCGWQGQSEDPNCCVNASGGAGGPAKRPGTRQAEPGAGVVSSITGTAVEYGHGAGGNVNAKSAKNGVVIIAYNLAAAEAEATPPPTTAAPTTIPAPTTTPAPTSPPVDIGAIIREYDTKMAQLKEAMAAEKQALLDQNASAAEQARAVKEQLTADLYALKKAYDELVARLATTTSEYDTKLAQLEAAKKAELDAAKAQNEAAVAAAQAAQAKLQEELEGLKLSGTVSSKEIAALKAMLGSGQGIGRTLYVIVHAPSWLEQGELNALTLSDSGTISVAPYKYRDYTQTFALAPNGSIIRCLSRSGLYLVDEGCSTPISSESFAAPWSLFSTGRHTLERLIASRKCGKYLASLMHNEVSFESIPTPWYLVPVGSMS